MLHRNAGLFVAVSLISGFGATAMSITAGVWVMSLTGSPGLAGLAALFVYLPSLAGPVLGVAVDRLPRKRVLIGTNLAMGLLLLTLLAVRSGADVWLVYAVMLGYGISFVLLDAAESAVLPAAVPGDELATLNGVRISAQEGTKLIAPLAGAGLFAWAGGPPVALLSAGLLVVSAVLYGQVRLADPPRPLVPAAPVAAGAATPAAPAASALPVPAVPAAPAAPAVPAAPADPARRRPRARRSWPCCRPKRANRGHKSKIGEGGPAARGGGSGGGVRAVGCGRTPWRACARSPRTDRCPRSRPAPARRSRCPASPPRPCSRSWTRACTGRRRSWASWPPCRAPARSPAASPRAASSPPAASSPRPPPGRCSSPPAACCAPCPPCRAPWRAGCWPGSVYRGRWWPSSPPSSGGYPAACSAAPRRPPTPSCSPRRRSPSRSARSLSRTPGIDGSWW